MPVLIDLIAFFEDEEQKNEDHNPNRLKTLLLGTRSPFLLGFYDAYYYYYYYFFFSCSLGRCSPLLWVEHACLIPCLTPLHAWIRVRPRSYLRVGRMGFILLFSHGL